MTLEERISRLEDIEAIRCLQAKYQRCLDTRNFDEMSECFTEDATSSYGNGSMSYNGKDEIIGKFGPSVTNAATNTWNFAALSTCSLCEKQLFWIKSKKG